MIQQISHFHEYRTFVKERWTHKPLIDVLVSEFRTRSKDYYLEAIEAGVITVNDKNTKPNYILKQLDYIKHLVHLHEPITQDIKIIKWEEQYVAVSKPPGVPCHPTGAHFYHSLTKKLFPGTKCGCVNRIDVPVSGVVIIAFENLPKWLQLIKNTQKYYIAKVKGSFPSEIDVDQPIKCYAGIRRWVDDEGKPCLTKFKKVKENKEYSIVQCQPITGRTHQIRIHLAYLGFPIINDVIYGDYSPPDMNYYEECNVDLSEYDDQAKYECIKKHCHGTNNKAFRFGSAHICLHAWKYKFNDIEYEDSIPEWANID